MNKNKKFIECENCKGNLMPVKAENSNVWSLICENHHSKNCDIIYLEEEYQDVFKELTKWHLNDYEIHDLIKLSSNSTKIISSILFINNLNIRVYKKRKHALRSLLKSNFSYIVKRFIVLLRYKYNLLTKLIIAIIIIAIILISGLYSLLFPSYKNDFLEVSTITPITENQEQTQPKESNLTDKVNNLLDGIVQSEYGDKFSGILKSVDINSIMNVIDKDKIIQDSDQDGLSDIEEEYIHKTDPYSADTDNDGFTDKEEIDGGYDPLTPATK